MYDVLEIQTEKLLVGIKLGWFKWKVIFMLRHWLLAKSATNLFKSLFKRNLVKNEYVKFSVVNYISTSLLQGFDLLPLHHGLGSLRRNPPCQPHPARKQGREAL